MAPRKNRQRKAVPELKLPSPPSVPSSVELPSPPESENLGPDPPSDKISIRFQILYTEVFRELNFSELPVDAVARNLPHYAGFIDSCHLLLNHYGVSSGQHFGVKFIPQVGEKIAASSWSKMGGATIMLYPITEAQVPLYKQAQHLQYMEIPGMVGAPLYKQAQHLQSMSTNEKVDALLKVVEPKATAEPSSTGESKLVDSLTQQVKELGRLVAAMQDENRERMEELYRELEEFRGVIEELKKERVAGKESIERELFFESRAGFASAGPEELDGNWKPARSVRKQRPSVSRCENCAQRL